MEMNNNRKIRIGDVLKEFGYVTDADIDADELVKKLETMPPMDETAFVKKLTEMLADYTKGKDTSKLRITVKRKGSEA